MDMKKLAAEFAAQNKPAGKAGNVYYKGAVIYSYGAHFPIAYIRGGRAFFNSDGYSRSTSRHKSTVRAALSAYVISERTTAELRDLIRAEGAA